MATQSEKEWAERVVKNEDYLPWADVRKAKEILGLPHDGLTQEEQDAYARLVKQQSTVSANGGRHG